eukprot:gene17867-biopygen5159
MSRGWCSQPEPSWPYLFGIELDLPIFSQCLSRASIRDRQLLFQLDS